MGPGEQIQAINAVIIQYHSFMERREIIALKKLLVVTYSFLGRDGSDCDTRACAWWPWSGRD